MLLNLRTRLAIIAYAVTVAVLATSPIWIRTLILDSYQDGDNFGSGADVYVWFIYTAFSFLILCAATILSVKNIASSGQKTKIILLVFPIVAWVLAILYLLHMH